MPTVQTMSRMSERLLFCPTKLAVARCYRMYESIMGQTSKKRPRLSKNIIFFYFWYSALRCTQGRQANWQEAHLGRERRRLHSYMYQVFHFEQNYESHACKETTAVVVSCHL